MFTWRRELGVQPPRPAIAPPQMVRVCVEDAPKPNGSSSMVEIVLPNGVRLVVAADIEPAVQGVSMRSVDYLVKALGGSGVSSQVSRLREAIDEKVDAFLTRPPAGGWPYVWLDATTASSPWR